MKKRLDIFLGTDYVSTTYLMADHCQDINRVSSFSHKLCIKETFA